VKFKPLLGSDLSGHLGGIVASHNTYGPYLRQRVRPVNAKSTAQQAQRAAVALIAKLWSQLDPTVRSAWIAASVVKTSRKGDKVTLTGQAAWMYVNILRQRAGLALVTAPPSGSSTITLTAPVVTLTSATAANIQFAGDSWNAPQGAVAISGGLLTSSGKSYLVPPRAVEIHANPGTVPYSVMLPFAVPINARVRLQFHATDPDGYQTTYKTVDALNPSFQPPILPPANVLRVTAEATGSNAALWEFDRPVAPATIAHLVIGTHGLISAANISANIIQAIYGNQPTPGDAWTISADATTPAAAPATGLVL
jgi:hypothetical protein